MQYIYNSKQNTAEPASSVSPPFASWGNVFAHIQKTPDQKLDKTQVNVPVTRFSIARERGERL